MYSEVYLVLGYDFAGDIGYKSETLRTAALSPEFRSDIVSDMSCAVYKGLAQIVPEVELAHYFAVIPQKV